MSLLAAAERPPCDTSSDSPAEPAGRANSACAERRWEAGGVLAFSGVPEAALAWEGEIEVVADADVDEPADAGVGGGAGVDPPDAVVGGGAGVVAIPDAGVGSGADVVDPADAGVGSGLGFDDPVGGREDGVPDEDAGPVGVVAAADAVPAGALAGVGAEVGDEAAAEVGAGLGAAPAEVGVAGCPALSCASSTISRDGATATTNTSSSAAAPAAAISTENSSSKVSSPLSSFASSSFLAWGALDCWLKVLRRPP